MRPGFFLPVLLGILMVLGLLTAGCTDNPGANTSRAITVSATPVPDTLPQDRGLNETYWIRIDPISDSHMGENVIIQGTTNLPVETKIYSKIFSPDKRCFQNECSFPDEFKGETTVTKRGNGVNNISIAARISSFIPGRYRVLVSCQYPGTDAVEDFTILSPNKATAAPKAWFTTGGHKNGAYVAADFIDLSKNYPTSWNWSFGDGNFSTEKNPSHNFPQDGIYQVSLTVSNSMGSDTAVQKFYWPIPI